MGDRSASPRRGRVNQPASRVAQCPLFDPQNDAALHASIRNSAHRLCGPLKRKHTVNARMKLALAYPGHDRVCGARHLVGKPLFPRTGKRHRQPSNSSGAAGS